MARPGPRSRHILGRGGLGTLFLIKIVRLGQARLARSQTTPAQPSHLSPSRPNPPRHVYPSLFYLRKKKPASPHDPRYGATWAKVAPYLGSWGPGDPSFNCNRAAGAREEPKAHIISIQPLSFNNRASTAPRPEIRHVLDEDMPYFRLRGRKKTTPDKF